MHLCWCMWDVSRSRPHLLSTADIDLARSTPYLFVDLAKMKELLNLYAEELFDICADEST